MQENKLSNWPYQHLFCTLQCADLRFITAATFTFQAKQNNIFYSVIVIKSFSCYIVQHIFLCVVDRAF